MSRCVFDTDTECTKRCRYYNTCSRTDRMEDKKDDREDSK